MSTSSKDSPWQNASFPPLVSHCIAYLVNYLDKEGLFRVPGDELNIRAIKKRYYKGKKVNLYGESPYDIACVLKRFFHDLSSPLLTVELYDCFIAAGGIPDEIVRKECLKKVLSQLPPENLAILKAVMYYCTLLVDHSNKNKMNASNLAIIFGPCLMRPLRDNDYEFDVQLELADVGHITTVISLFITEFDYLFSEQSKGLMNSSLGASSSTSPRSASQSSSVSTTDSRHSSPSLSSSSGGAGSSSSSSSAMQQSPPPLSPRPVLSPGASPSPSPRPSRPLPSPAAARPLPQRRPALDPQPTTDAASPLADSDEPLTKRLSQFETQLRRGSQMLHESPLARYRPPPVEAAERGPPPPVPVRRSNTVSVVQASGVCSAAAPFESQARVRLNRRLQLRPLPQEPCIRRLMRNSNESHEDHVQTRHLLERRLPNRPAVNELRRVNIIPIPEQERRAAVLQTQERLAKRLTHRPPPERLQEINVLPRENLGRFLAERSVSERVNDSARFASPPPPRPPRGRSATALPSPTSSIGQRSASPLPPPRPLPRAGAFTDSRAGKSPPPRNLSCPSNSSLLQANRSRSVKELKALFKSDFGGQSPLSQPSTPSGSPHKDKRSPLSPRLRTEVTSSEAKLKRRSSWSATIRSRVGRSSKSSSAKDESSDSEDK